MPLPQVPCQLIITCLALSPFGQTTKHTVEYMEHNFCDYHGISAGLPSLGGFKAPMSPYAQGLSEGHAAPIQIATANVCLKTSLFKLTLLQRLFHMHVHCYAHKPDSQIGVVQGLHHAMLYQVRITCAATTRADHACVLKWSCWSRPVFTDGQLVLEPCANDVPGAIRTTADELWQHGRQEEMVQPQLNNAMLGQALANVLLFPVERLFAPPRRVWSERL